MRRGQLPPSRTVATQRRSMRTTPARANSAHAALARALGLTPTRTGYLHALCDLLWDDPERVAATPVDSTLLRMMDSWSGSAAFVLDPLLEVVATNDLADALFSPFTVTRNLAEMVFLDVGARSFYVDWDRAALSCVGALRRNMRFVADVARREELIARLIGGSAEFEELWARHEVEAKAQGHKVLFHPVAGEITIDFHTFGVTSLAGSELVVYQAELGSNSERRLRALIDTDIPELA